MRLLWNENIFNFYFEHYLFFHKRIENILYAPYK